MRILNLYAGIGGNRKYWEDAEITAVEIDPIIADVYHKLYPQDIIIVGDAHKYLLEHYRDFDFIWSSPPCPSHSQYRYNVGFRAKGYKPIYPDMSLYEEIIFLQYYFSGVYCVENVISYYKPLIQPQKIGRHYFWANFIIEPINVPTSNIREKNKISDFEDGHLIATTGITNKIQVLRNCVNSFLGAHILKCAKKVLEAQNTKGAVNEK